MVLLTIVPRNIICTSTEREREVRETLGNSTDDSSKTNAKMLKYDYYLVLLKQYFRAELGMYPLKTNIYIRKLKRQYKVRNMPKNRLPATVDGAV